MRFLNNDRAFTLNSYLCIKNHPYFLLLVIPDLLPAYAGTDPEERVSTHWIPAFAETERFT
jgi:hypothetical protein